MHLQSLVAGIGLAVAATNALLLPPDVTIADDVITTLPVPIGTNADIAISQVADTQTVDLDCPGCLRVGRHQRKEIPSHLKLKFRVESTHGADRLTLNGYELYPSPDPLRHVLTAPVLPNMSNRRVGSPRFRGGPNRFSKDMPLGFALGTEIVTTDDDEDLKLIHIDVQIIEVGDVLYQNIPNVQVKLIKTPSGKLAIGAIETMGPQSRPTDGVKAQKECTTMVCKWKTRFFDKLSRVLSKGCGRAQAGSQPGVHSNDKGDGNTWANGVIAFFKYVLRPLLIGALIGVSASLLGMMVGTLLIYVWIKLFRRGGSRSSHRCRYAHKAPKDETAIKEEKAGLLNGQDEFEAPPMYAEAVDGDKKPENEV